MTDPSDRADFDLEPPVTGYGLPTPRHDRFIASIPPLTHVTTEGDLRVWHIPQVPGTPFYVRVSSVDDGTRICEILAAYDAFQFDHSIKPDYCNVNGIERFEDCGDQFDWYEVDVEFERDES